MNSTFNSSSNNTFRPTGECTVTYYPRKLYSNTFAWVIITIYSFIFLFGIIGNMLTCLAVFIHKSMRRSIHVYMVNLAIADIIIIFIFVPTQSALIYNNLAWNMGRKLCVVMNVISPTCITCSIATLTAISVDRYSGVRDPFAWRIKSTRNSKVIVPLTWILSTCSAVPYYVFGGLKYSRLGDCRCMWPNSPMKTVYMTTMMVIQYIFPFMLIASLSMHIIWIIARGRESINKLHRRMVKMVIMMLLTYLVCGGMQYIYFYYQMFHEILETSYASYIYIFSNLLLTLQAAVNPLIYSSIRDDFNLAFKTLIAACGFTITKIIIQGQESYSDDANIRRISQTDTERMYSNSLDRKMSSISARKCFETPEPRKISSIFNAMRKHSLHVRDLRKKSSIREIPYFAELDSIGGCSDQDEEELPTFRSYRLGTLEFLELEDFHERMKQEIRKESKVRKISRIFNIGGGFVPENHIVSDGNNTAEVIRHNKHLSKALCRSISVDSLPISDDIKLTNRLGAKFSRPEKLTNPLINTTLLPLTFLVGEMSRSFKNTDDGIEKTSPETFTENPSHNTESSESVNDIWLSVPTGHENKGNMKTEESYKPLCTEDSEQVSSRNTSPNRDNTQPLKLAFRKFSEHVSNSVSSRKWSVMSVDSYIHKLKSTSPDESEQNVGKTHQGRPKKRARKQAISRHNADAALLGRRMSHNVVDWLYRKKKMSTGKKHTDLQALKASMLASNGVVCGIKEEAPLIATTTVEDKCVKSCNDISSQNVNSPSAEDGFEMTNNQGSPVRDHGRKLLLHAHSPKHSSDVDIRNMYRTSPKSCNTSHQSLNATRKDTEFTEKTSRHSPRSSTSIVPSNGYIGERPLRTSLQGKNYISSSLQGIRPLRPSLQGKEHYTNSLPLSSNSYTGKESLRVLLGRDMRQRAQTWERDERTIKTGGGEQNNVSPKLKNISSIYDNVDYTVPKTGKISIYEQETYQDMLAKQSRANSPVIPELSVSQGTAEYVRFAGDNCNFPTLDLNHTSPTLVTFLHAKESPV